MAIVEKAGVAVVFVGVMAMVKRGITVSAAQRPDHSLAAVDDLSVDELLAKLNDSGILETFGVAKDAPLLVRDDSDLVETLKIIQEFLTALRDAGVVETFLHLPKSDQAGLLRIIGMTDGSEARRDRTGMFISSLKESPAGDQPGSSSRYHPIRL